MKKIERGEKAQKETGVYFTSLEAFKKVLTPKRMELLHVIKTEKPGSIFGDRDLKGRVFKGIRRCQISSFEANSAGYWWANSNLPVIGQRRPSVTP